MFGVFMDVERRLRFSGGGDRLMEGEIGARRLSTRDWEETHSAVDLGPLRSISYARRSRQMRRGRFLNQLDLGTTAAPPRSMVATAVPVFLGVVTPGLTELRSVVQ
jgi:hypothetical protein